MKKLFLLFCVNMFAFCGVSCAGITEMNNIEQLRTRKQEIETPREIKSVINKNLNDPQALKEFLEERFKKAEIADFDDDEDLNSANAMNIQHSQEYINQMAEEEKSTFEKIYDAAVQRLTSSGNDERKDILSGDTVFYREAAQQENDSLTASSGGPTVEIILPSGEKTLAPAMEHIPYLFTHVEIMPTGTIKVDETVIVVANSQKLRYGLTKKLPKYSKSRTGEQHRLEYDLLNASINGRPFDHELVEEGRNFLLKPKENYILSPGVYTYKFSYIIDRQLWVYDDFNEFYWDVSGSKWNLLISKAGATVSYPNIKPSISQNVLVGYPDKVSPYRARIMKYAENGLAFVSTTPLLAGEGMHILISLPKEDFIKPDFSRRFVWFINDYGDNVFALFGLAAILFSYMISWYYIKTDKTKGASYLKKTPAVLRYLLSGAFDRISFGGILLDFYRRNIIDIEESQSGILLVKKTDDTKSLSRGERKALGNIFGGKEDVLKVDSHTGLKLQRAYKICAKETARNMKFMYFQMNISYLLFSIAMLMTAQIAISLNGVNFLQTFVLLVSASLIVAFYIWMIRAKFKSKLLSAAVKVFSALIILFTLFLMSGYISKFATLMILAMIVTIFAYSSIFAARNGLIRSKIKEALKYRNYLENNAVTICLGREFLAQQPNIFALELEKFYNKEGCRKDYNKLDVMARIVKIL